MKPTHYFLFLLCLTFSSCVTFKQFDNRAKSARETSYEASIVKKDGKIISGEVLKHKNHDPYDANLVRVINSENAFTIDGQNYHDSNVVAFQDKKAYHKRFNNIFLVRLVKGKINLYYFDNTGYDKTTTFNSGGPTTINSTSTRKSAFFFEKEKDKILPIGISELKKAVEDNQKVLNKLTSYYPKDSYSKELNIEKLVSVVEAYNE
jgi:hypothetical protein